MAGPWEQYAAQPDSAPQGPWQGYAPTPSLKDQANAAIKDFVGGAAEKLNPINKLRGVVDMLQAVHDDPVGTVGSFAKEVLAHPYVAFSRGVEAAKAGRIEEAAAHFSNALEPAGFATEGSEVKMATPGQRAAGAGEMVGTGLDALLSGKAPEILQKARGMAASGIKKAVSVLPETTQEEQDAIGILSPRLKNLLRTANRVQGATAEPPALPAEAVPPPIPGPSIPEGVDPAIWEKLSPQMQEALRQKMAGPIAPKPAPTSVAPVEWQTAEEKAAAAAKAAAPAPVAAPAAASAAPAQSLDDALNGLLRKTRIESGADPDLHLGELKHGHYPERFSGDDSPVINQSLGLSKTNFMDSLPENSPLRGNPKALDAAYKLAKELKRNGISVLMKGKE